MKIREKTLLTGVTVFIILFLSLTYFELTITRDNLEKSSMIVSNQKEQFFKKILEKSLEDVVYLCRDWALRDDTYEFVSSKNQEYIKSNLNEETFRNARINLMVIFDRGGEIVFAKFYDSEWYEREIPGIFLSGEILGKSGYLLFNESFILVSSEPILRSDGSGEPNGYFLLGRILTGEEIGEIGETLGVNISFVPYEVKEFFGKKVVSSLELEDLLGKRFFVKMEQENPLYTFYLNNLLLSIGFLGLVSFIMLFAMILVLDRELISKIMKLEKFKQTARVVVRIEIKWSEELVNLANSINSMLERIGKDEEELRFLLRILRHDLSNVLTSSITYLELCDEKPDSEILEKAKKSIEHGINIIKVVKQLESKESKEFDIQKVIEDLGRAYSVEVEIKGDARVVADDGIYTIFGNLIQNAIEHGKATKILVEIEKGDNIVVRFSDNGKGFSEEAKSKVFRESYSEKGSGFGSFIVKKLIEKYGGSVELQGKNTIVLRFPARGNQLPLPAVSS